jgi:heat-inducible transcriptional repressor
VPPTGIHKSSDTDREFGDRQRRLLALLVREYIDRGEPVSSLWLADHCGARVSSATVRNILSRLELDGYLHQPHTSAGRIPTDLGYRAYVDLLLQGRRPSRPSPEVEARLRQAGTVDDVLENVSHELSRTSHHLAFALAPVDDQIALRQVEFVALDATRVLVVLVAESGQVWQKLVTSDAPSSPADLTQAANYVTREFGGRRLADIRQEIVARLQEDRAVYDTLMARALHLASTTLADVSVEPRVVVHGASSLLDDTRTDAEAIPLDQLRAVLAMIEEKHRLVQLLTAYLEGPGLTVVIGAEHPVPDLRNFSLVAAAYVDDGRLAAVGVLGPRRMRYSRAIAAVDSVSQAVGRARVGPGGH